MRSVYALKERGAKRHDIQNEARLTVKLEALRDVALALLEEIETPESFENGDLQEAVRRYETCLIVRALERTEGNQSRAARLLGVKHTTLNEKIKRYRISSRAKEVASYSLTAVKR